IERHRRPERVLLCRECGAREAQLPVFDWTFCGQPAQMHPNYMAELEALRRGARMSVAAPGTRVRVTAEGDFSGSTGTVVKRGRTRYRLQLDTGEGLSVLFSCVTPVDTTSTAEAPGVMPGMANPGPSTPGQG